MYLVHPSEHRAHPVATPLSNKSRVRLPYCVHAGTNLFREQDKCAGLFEVASGVLRLSRLTRGGRRYVVGFGFPGDTLGYGPDQYHISDCDAITDAKVTRHRPETLFKGGGQLREALVIAALRQVKDMQDHCMVLGRISSCDRVAAFLSLLGHRLGTSIGKCVEFDLPMTRADIADYLGLTPETVSRSLTDLRNKRLIAIEKVHHVILLQPQCLEALAEDEV